MKITAWKMLAVSCILLGLSIIAFADVCKNIQPMDDFSLERFSGSWYMPLLKIGNPSDQARYKQPRCGHMIFNIDEEQKPLNWTVVLDVGGKTIYIGGNYTIPDEKKGFLKLEYLKRSAIYDYVIKCTDYETYSVGYSCVQVEPEEISEFIHILTKDPTKYEEIIALPKVKECFSDIFSEPIEEELQKLPFDNCPNIENPDSTNL